MNTRYNIPIYDICWLRHAKGGTIGTFYEPETLGELIVLCRRLFKEGKKFDIIGYTSNIYFLPSYNVDIMVSTRKVKDVRMEDNYIIADCGTSVSKLANQMINQGIKGFEGLIDLPGTIAASVYGNASCYDCSINSILESFDLLRPNGEIRTFSVEDLKLSKRSTSLKRKDLIGVILSVKLIKEYGNAEQLKKIAEKNHQRRKNTQPPQKDNLGSIYSDKHVLTKYGFVLKCIARTLLMIYGLTGKTRKQVRNKQKDIILFLSGGKEVIPYVYDWNRYIWKDERSHGLFWKYHRIHEKLFKKSNFEIEIRGNI